MQPATDSGVSWAPVPDNTFPRCAARAVSIRSCLELGNTYSMSEIRPDAKERTRNPSAS